MTCTAHYSVFHQRVQEEAIEEALESQEESVPSSVDTYDKMEEELRHLQVKKEEEREGLRQTQLVIILWTDPHLREEATRSQHCQSAFCAKHDASSSRPKIRRFGRPFCVCPAQIIHFGFSNGVE